MHVWRILLSLRANPARDHKTRYPQASIILELPMGIFILILLSSFLPRSTPLSARNRQTHNISRPRCSSYYTNIQWGPCRFASLEPKLGQFLASKR
ncbi:hypothetical protein K439DRAFT_123589 [Ramaria rubella]|nr:hypothetical protein K439DRAFT_123589 [Ramaria rubella]